MLLSQTKVLVSAGLRALPSSGQVLQYFSPGSKIPTLQKSVNTVLELSIGEQNPVVPMCFAQAGSPKMPTLWWGRYCSTRAGLCDLDQRRQPRD